MKRTWTLQSAAGLALILLLGVIVRAEEAQPKLPEGSPDGLSSADATTDGIETYEQQKEAAPGWKIPQPSFLANHGFTVGGWLEQGIAFSNHPDDAFNGSVFTTNWNGEYQLNQFWLFIDRPAKNNGEGVAWGAHLDMVYGTDWVFGICHGLEDRINDFNRQSYGFVIPQAYGEVAIDKLTVKLGHYAGILGYEVVAAPPNPFYTHSYAMAFSEPILVTGALAEYKLSDRWTLLGGIDRGWMTWEDVNNIWDFMGGVRWMSESKKTAVAYSVDVGPQDPAGVQQRFVSSLVLKQQLTERLQYVLQNDMGQEQNALPDGDSAQWYGINQYLLYKLSDHWSANFRGEWFRDNNGVRVAGVPEDAGIRLWSLSGFAGNFYEVTLGLNWRPNANILFRPEIRYDWYNGETNASGLLPFNNGESNSQLLFAGDLIFTF